MGNEISVAKNWDVRDASARKLDFDSYQIQWPEEKVTQRR
jgi:hypothetical protein